MTRDETIALWQKCEEARAAALAEGRSKREAHEEAKKIWNAWAMPLKVKRDELLHLGLINLVSLQPEGFIASPKKALDSEIESFRSEAAAVFYAHDFPNPTDFSGFVFPGEVIFGEFQYYFDCQPATFCGSTWFDECVFCDDVRYVSVKFIENTGFCNALFLADANFAGAEFCHGVSFRKVEFQGEVWFGEVVSHSYCNFINAVFSKDASFRGIKALGAFDLTGVKFVNSVPAFLQSNFKEAPDFDNAMFPLPGFLTKDSRLNIGRYRAIRRLSIQGHDHENESKAFKGELRARRLIIDKPWHAAFWICILYDIFSDFGNSIIRPFYIWLLSIAGFAIVYMVNAGKIGDFAAVCAKQNADTAPNWLTALALSTKSALVFSGAEKKIDQLYGCLYGDVVPVTNTFIQIMQTLSSATLLFLLLLAVRNRFRIK